MVLRHPRGYNSPETAQTTVELNKGAEQFRRKERADRDAARLRREAKQERQGGGSDERTSRFLGDLALDGVDLR